MTIDLNPSPALIEEVESSFVNEVDAAIAEYRLPPRYGGLRYSASWWASRAWH